MKRTMTLMLVLSCWLSANAVLSLEEVRTASDNVIVVFFKNEGENAEVDDVDVTDPSQWTVNGSPAEAVNIYVMPQSGFNNHVYLTVAELVDGTEYEISTPHGDTTFTFDERETFCEAIKTNQGAYSELASTNYALFSIWLGDGGAKEISGSLPEYEVFEVYTGDQVAQGSIEEIGEDQTSGDFVYRIDLSDVPEGGPYKISVNGCGASHPFGVGGAFSRKLGYTLFRGQYFQRCGVPLRTPYAEHDIRMNPCHTTVYEVNGEIGEANVEVSGDEPTFECYGGYHDAGDADRRAYHMANPIVNLAVYETFPDLFVDEQYNIPTVFDSEYNIEGKGNGVPDIIDEAEWGTLVWEYLQNDDGTIHFGTETDGYPSPFDAPLDEDDKPYGTWVTDDRATATGAGLFMHLARILEPYKPERSQELAERAQLAFNAAGSISDPERLYYYIQKYLYDGDESAHQEIRSLQGAVDDFSNNYMAETGTMGYSLNDDKFDNAAYFISYILESDRETDPEIVERFTSALRTGADNSINDLESYTYPLGTDPGGWGWGQSVRQPRLAFAPILQWGVSEEQEYIDAAAELMNYKLGLNPLGISYVTGVGFHRVHNIHDRESAYTKGMGWGCKTGLTVFGPRASDNENPPMIPAIDNLALEKQFADDEGYISQTEFTIFETMSHDVLYTILSGGGTWDPENEDPFDSQQSSQSIDRRTSQLSDSDIGTRSLRVVSRGNGLHLLGAEECREISLYSIHGRRVMQNKGSKAVIPYNAFPSGLYIVKASMGERLQSTKIILP